MKQGAVRILEEELKKAGRFRGRVDGKVGLLLDRSVNRFLKARATDLTGFAPDWTAARKRVAAFQLVCKDAGIDPGPADGLWGSLTETAYGDFRYLRANGELPINFRDIEPGAANPHTFPTDRPGQAELFDFFDFNPEKGGQPPTVMVSCPWTLKIDWNRNQTTRRIGCHPKVAESLERVLVRIADRYDAAQRADMGLDIYGGCLNVRRKRGGTTWSTHSFAAAIDFDPSRNKLQWGWKQARLAQPDCLDFWSFWEEEGWLSLGREKNFDWMHVQAIKLP